MIVRTVTHQRFNFNHLLADQAFSYYQATTVEGDYDLKIDRLEYYLSEIEITHDGGIVTAIDDLYLPVHFVPGSGGPIYCLENRSQCHLGNHRIWKYHPPQEISQDR